MNHKNTIPSPAHCEECLAEYMSKHGHEGQATRAQKEDAFRRSYCSFERTNPVLHSNSIHGPDVNERHERNKRAIAYLERLKARDEQREDEKPGVLTLILTWTGGIGIGFALWWAGHQLFKAFTSTL